jgi:hypothetical protein
MAPIAKQDLKMREIATKPTSKQFPITGTKVCPDLNKLKSMSPAE